jgi:drug/metabolite transporter (DMT)-like permease
MSGNASGYAAIALLVVLSFLFQTQLKQIAMEVAPVLARAELGLADRLWSVMRTILTWRAALVVTIAGALFVIWFFALTKLDLSVALPLASIALVVNAIGGGLMLGEPLSWTRIAGAITVATGIALVLNS